MLSVVCAVKDRAAALRVSLTSWLLAPGVDEVVVVDWSSSTSIIPLTALDSRIKLVRVNEEPTFHLAAAFNLAADVATGDTLLKLDADYVLNPFYSFVHVQSLAENAFVTGHFQHGGPFLSYLNGLIYVRKHDWQRVHGYNENLVNYGWDDDDFYIRLGKAGLSRTVLKPNPVLAFHIPHDNALRVQNYANKNAQQSYQHNRQFLAAEPYTARKFTWKLTPASEQAFIATKQPNHEAANAK